MMETFRAPDIRWSSLSGDHTAHDDTDDTDHPPYTTETLRRAITRGMASDGRPLDPVMPRWQMSEQDLEDLTEFLQILGADDRSS